EDLRVGGVRLGDELRRGRVLLLFSPVYGDLRLGNLVCLFCGHGSTSVERLGRGQQTGTEAEFVQQRGAGGLVIECRRIPLEKRVPAHLVCQRDCAERDIRQRRQGQRLRLPPQL